MASEIVQFRVSAEDLELLRKHGYTPNVAARDRLLGLIQALRSKDADERVRKLFPKPLNIDAAQAVRESRQELEDRS